MRAGLALGSRAPAGSQPPRDREAAEHMFVTTPCDDTRRLFPLRIGMARNETANREIRIRGLYGNRHAHSIKQGTR
jgi:hypothetical protein